MEQRALLHDDSAIALYRAARAADPTYIVAHFEYIRMLQRRFRVAELHREYATTDTTSALKQCLMAASWIGQEDMVHPRQLANIEKRFGPNQCTDAFINYSGVGYVAERTARAVRDNPVLSEVWGITIGAHHLRGEWDAADRTAAAAIRAMDDPIERVMLSFHRIGVRYASGDSASAFPLWDALEAAVERDGRPGPLAVYLTERCSNRQYPDPRLTNAARAEYCRRFYAVVRSRRALFQEYVLTRSLSDMRLDRGELDVAIPLMTRLTRLSDSLSPGLQLEAYGKRGRAYSKAGQLALALQDLKRAVALGPSVEMPYFHGEAWHNLAHTYEGLGRFAEAAAAADSFAAVADQNPDATARWMSRHDAGEIRWKAGWHAAAVKDFETMKRIVDELGNNGHYFVGEYLERRGELGRALDYYRTGFSLPSGDPRTHSALVRVYETLGLKDSAYALARLHDAQSDRWPITGQPMLPDLLAARGRLQEAVSLAGAWARQATNGGNVEGAAIAQVRFAELLLLHGDAKAALVAATTADSLSRLLNLTAHKISARTLAGRALIDQGRRAEGLAALEEAVRLANAHPSTESARATNLALGDALVSAGRRGDALAAYDNAAASVERMTAGWREDAYRTGYKATHLAPFDGALRTLLRSTSSTVNASAALEWSVRRKAAALRLAGQPESEAQRMSVSALRGRLGSGEALIDFTVLDSSVAAIIVRRDAITSVALTATPSQLSAWTETLRRPFVTTPGGRIDLAHTPFDAAAAANLYQSLIAPLESALTGVKSVAIAPDGALWYVPFAALVTGRANGRASYLIERYEMRLLPSAQFLNSRDGNSLPPGFRVDAFSYSVPGGDAELSAIRSSLGAARVSERGGSGATERAALGAKANVLHLAVHGSVDDRDPLSSHLRLAPEALDDGLLHVAEVADRRLPHRLVVLTACEAVNGKLYAGEGLLGIARAFLIAGARHVVASEWPVHASAAQLSGVLYRELSLGRSPSAALRSAQLALLATPQTGHPIHWAGFVAFEARAPSATRLLRP